MARGGKRKGAGRKRKIRIIEELPAVITKNQATELVDALNRPADKKDSHELEQWRTLWEAQDLRIRLDTRKYLYDKRDGKPVQTINHLHDKPLEVNMNISLGERMKVAMQKAEERVGKRGS